MAAKKKALKKTIKKIVPKKAPAKKTAVNKAAKTAVSKASASLLYPRLGATVVYVDSCFFFPGASSSGYIENFQEGRNTVTPGHGLMACLPLPVGATIKTITLYYKNTSKEDMQVIILKKHIDHHCFSGEVEVSLDFLPPATLAPDNFVEKVINHFDAGGLIKDKYLYFIEITNTIKTAEAVRTVRGMRLEYVV
jgi:hypothetical protein